jgi:PAS domain S-box-containing protein
MVPNTAVALLLAGTAGALRHKQDGSAMRRALALLAGLVGVGIGAGTIAEYALGMDLGIDQLLIHGAQGPHPGRPSSRAALALLCLGLALILSDVRLFNGRARPSEWLLLLAAMIGFTSLVGILFGADAFYRLAAEPHIGVAVPTAIAILLAAAGLLLARPSVGLMSVATSTGPGGVILRRLAAPVALIPVLLGFVIGRMYEAFWTAWDFPLVIAILTSSMALVSIVLLVVTAVPLNRAHAALELNRTRTRNLVEQAPDGIFVADLDGHYIEVNTAWCRMLGYSADEIVGKRVVDLIAAQEIPRLSEAKRKVLSGSVQVADWTLRRKDGTYLPVEVSAALLPDGRWQGFVRDISGRKQAEDALRASEAKFAGVISIAADAMISLDEEQRITMYNDAAREIFGWRAEEVIGKPLDVLIPERQRDVHRQRIREFATEPVKSRTMGQGEPMVGLRKSGEEFPVDASISKLTVGGNLLFTLALRDATERVRFDREQRFLMEFSAALAASLDFGDIMAKAGWLAVRQFTDACIVDLVDEPGRPRRLMVIHSDPAKAGACRTLETFPPDAASPMGRAMATRQPLLVAEFPRAYLESTAHSREHLNALLELGLNSAVIAPMISRDRVLGALAFITTSPLRRHDARDLRVAQELAHRTVLALDNARLYETAQRAIRARDDILGIVAHDLRNPLGTILIQTALLRRRGKEPERRTQKPLDTIRRSAMRMNRLIQDLLDVTRMEAGRLAIEARPVHTRELVAESIHAQESMAASASLELRSELEQGLPDVCADRDRLLQVFENLIGNAVKFTPAGGFITVGAAPKGHDIVFRVADTGRGISADNMPHLFERFWQARKSERSGTGLGLPIVKGLVEAHGGRIWVESALGHGTTFFFSIPMAPVVERSESERAPQRN